MGERIGSVVATRTSIVITQAVAVSLACSNRIGRRQGNAMYVNRAHKSCPYQSNHGIAHAFPGPSLMVT